MNKTVRKVLSFIMVFVIICVAYNMVAFAHNLEKWANYYTKIRACTETDHFSIDNSHHVDGDKLIYYWQTPAAENNFSNVLINGFNMWGGQ